MHSTHEIRTAHREVTREAIAANFLANPAGSTITASGSGVIVATENIAGSAGNTEAITSFVSQNTLSTVNETLYAVTLGVRHLTGGAGADTLTGDAQANWLAGGLGPTSSTQEPVTTYSSSMRRTP